MKIIHNSTVITPDDGAVHTRHGHSLVFANGRIIELGPASGFQHRVAAGEFSEVIAGDRHVVIPGLINTHHHLCQALTRCLPSAQNERLFGWLLQHYQRWQHLDYAAVNVAAKVSIAELLLHGCTTTSDHFYMVPPNSDVRMEAVLEAADELGIRLHLCRGAMTLGQSQGGLPPDDCVEEDDEVLADCQRVLEKYHDPSDYAMRRIDLAPCSPFNCTRELLRESVGMAREHEGVLLHTHLAETLDEERFCLDRYGCRPVQFLADLGFLGPDVYLAHCVHVNDEEIALLAETHTGVSHNPSSNMRLGSGVAPLRKLLDAGVRVGLGVDGASSNDGSDLLGEARQALLLARVLPALEQATEPRTHEGTGRPSAATKPSRAVPGPVRREDTPALLRTRLARESSRTATKSTVCSTKGGIAECGSRIAEGAWSHESAIRNRISETNASPLFPVVEAFKLATVGGAACLNRPVLGHLNAGAAADFAMFRTDDIALAGALAQDPLAALLLCAAPRADRVYVAGREVVHDGRIVALDERHLAEHMNKIVEAGFRG